MSLVERDGFQRKWYRRDAAVRLMLLERLRERTARRAAGVRAADAVRCPPGNRSPAMAVPQARGGFQRGTVISVSPVRALDPGLVIPSPGPRSPPASSSAGTAPPSVLGPPSRMGVAAAPAALPHLRGGQPLGGKQRSGSGLALVKRQRALKCRLRAERAARVAVERSVQSGRRRARERVRVGRMG